MKRLEEQESKYCCHRKVKHENGWSKRTRSLKTRLSCVNVGTKARQPSRSFPPTSFCFALPLKKICRSFAPTSFCFALPLKKICLPFAPTVYMFHYPMRTIFTFILL